jgi:tRNA (guanine37-N1)-methyltransferase
VVTSYALIVPIAKGEDARRFVASQGIGRNDLKLGRTDTTLLIPIQQPIDASAFDGRVEVVEFEAAKTPLSYKERARVPPEVRAELPSSFDIVGDLVVIKVPDPLRVHEDEIGRAILEAHPKLRGVFLDEGVEGPLRIRNLRCIGGADDTRTVHAEFGARFQVDLRAAYFSPRLANEHERVARAVRPGETFFDATAGVGPFSVLAARIGLAKRIIAADLNPQAVALLRENLVRNKVADRVEVIEGDAIEVANQVGPFERAAVNLPHAGEPILRAVWRQLAPHGTVHYTVVWPEEEARARADALAATLGNGGPAARIAHMRVVHPYSPRDRLYALDFEGI